MASPSLTTSDVLRVSLIIRIGMNKQLRYVTFCGAIKIAINRGTKAFDCE